MGPASALLLGGIASSHSAHGSGSHPPADRNGLTATPTPCPWLTCAFPTVVVLAPAPGGGDSSLLPALQTTAQPASLSPRMTTGPPALLGAELLQVAAASWARARLPTSYFQNGGTVPVQCHPHRHKPGLKGELISVGKAPRAAVTQSPVAEITGLYIAILGTAISAGRAWAYHQLLGQSAVEQNFLKIGLLTTRSLSGQPSCIFSNLCCQVTWWYLNPSAAQKASAVLHVCAVSTEANHSSYNTHCLQRCAARSDCLAQQRSRSAVLFCSIKTSSRARREQRSVYTALQIQV